MTSEDAARRFSLTEFQTLIAKWTEAIAQPRMRRSYFVFFFALRA